MVRLSAITGSNYTVYYVGMSGYVDVYGFIKDLCGFVGSTYPSAVMSQGVGWSMMWRGAIYYITFSPCP